MARPFQDLELTPKMVDLIKIFLEDPDESQYGFDLMRRTRQPSGTLYPNLAKFANSGWLELGTEDIDPHTEGRPPRRFYRITGGAIVAARLQLAALSERYRPPTPTRPRLSPYGSTL